MSSSLTVCEPHPLVVLEELSRLRRRSVVLYSGSFSAEVVTTWYAFLRELGKQEALDVIFQSYGGDPTQARRLAVLLREFTKQLSIFVLHSAISAGTLFCLAADEIIMSPLSTLGPIDPQVPGSLPELTERIGTSQQQGGLAPRSIATEEVRLFREMANSWFGVGESVEERFSLLHAFESRIFPTTLTAFYRADQEMRESADELLRYHQPDPALRSRISKRLIDGFFSHSHAIHCEEARELGLPVRQATDEEEACLWRLLAWIQAYQDLTHTDPKASGVSLRVGGVLVGVNGFAAHDVWPMAAQSEISPPPAVPETTPSAPDSRQRETIGSRSMRNGRWGWRQIAPDALSIEPDVGEGES